MEKLFFVIVNIMKL